MKKILAVFLAALTLAGCADTSKKYEPVTITNPVELETLTPVLDGYEFLEDSDPVFREITLAESVRMFEEKGSGILYYGRVGCFWCQRMVPALNEAAKEMGVEVYYVDVDLQTSKEAYDKLVTYIESIFEVNEKTGKGEFKVPEVIGVKNGEITGHHLSLVSSFDPDKQDVLTDEQYEELKTIYKDIIVQTAD